MKKSVAGIIVVLVAIGVVAGILLATKKDKNSSTTTSTTTSTQSSTQTPSTQNTASSDNSSSSSVTIQNFTFGPDKITIKAGTTVTWTQKDDIGHTVTPDNPTDEFKASGTLSKGDTYIVTFTKAGTYTYHCQPHPYMKGTITVTE